MRTVFGGSAAGARKTGGQISQSAIAVDEIQQKQSDKPDRIVRRINGDRIKFADLARFAWPTKTESHLAHLSGFDARTCRRWLAEDTEPPAEALGIILAEIMRRLTSGNRR